MLLRRICLCFLIAMAAPSAAHALTLAPQTPPNPGTTSTDEAGQERFAEPATRIMWFGRWKDAKAEAARTQRPILFMSAAPQCGGAPGMW